MNPFLIGDLERLHRGSHTLSRAGLQRESSPLKPLIAGACWYWAAEQTSCWMLQLGWEGGISAKRIRNQLLDGWMQTTSTRCMLEPLSNPLLITVLLFFHPPLALFLFGLSFVRISGCCRDLGLSVTARSTLIIHFGIFGILFSPPVSPSISALLMTSKGSLNHKKKKWQCLRRKHGEE